MTAYENAGWLKNGVGIAGQHRLSVQRGTCRRGIAAEGAPVVDPVLQHDIHVMLGRRPQQVAQLRRQVRISISPPASDAGTQLRASRGTERSMHCAPKQTK